MSVATALLVVSAGLAQPAWAEKKPSYVAIVVSGHVTACVRWHSGITGDEVLNATATVRYRQPDGIIVQIDGEPSPPRADNDHYWSYWHSSGGGWSYSDIGASGYSPAAGTVEGWSFVDGATKTPPAQNPGGLYAAICGSKDPAPAPASASTSSTSRHDPAPSSSTSHAAGGLASTISNGHPRVEARARPLRGPGSTVVNTPARAGTTAVPSAASPGSRATATEQSNPVAPGTPIVSDVRPAAAERRPSAGAAWPTIVALILAAAFGGAGVWAARRRRGLGAG
ncbi:MAG: hypothetical protein ABI345_00280 [Jatrophihabitans sp.]